MLGISPDSPRAQTSFKQKHQISFTLLCDEDKSVALAYGVLKEKNLYGKMVKGVERSTFVIGADSRIRKIFARVKPEGHAAEVLSVL